MKKTTFEAKDATEALKLATAELRVNPQYITLSQEDKKSMLGLKKSAVFTATVNVNLLDLGYKFLQETLNDLEIESKVQAEQDTETGTFKFKIDSPHNPLLIGRGGKTLQGFQTYLRNLLSAYSDEHVKVVLDIGDYKENRNRQLEILATKTAKEVARTKVAATLKDLNSYERRIVHAKLSEWRDITTTSEGEEPNRTLVIKPKG
jgi:spoIIIJ-associated protein